MPRRASVVPVSDLSFSEVSRVAWRYFQSKTGKPKGVLFIPPMNKVSLETNKVAFGKITSCWPSPWPKQTWGYTYAVWSGIPSRVLDLWDLSIVTVLWRSKRREKRSCPNYPANTRKLPTSFSAYLSPRFPNPVERFYNVYCMQFTKITVIRRSYLFYIIMFKNFLNW